MTNQLSHFAIHVDDLDRARKFYGAVFDWKFQGFGGGPITDFCQIKDASGNLLAPLGAIQSRKFNPAPQPVLGFECSFAVETSTRLPAPWKRMAEKSSCQKPRFPASAGSLSSSIPRGTWLAPSITIRPRDRASTASILH